MFTFAFIIHLIFLASYIGFFWALTYHIRNYQLPGESLPVSVRVLVLAMIILAIFSVIAFLSVPWNDITSPSLDPRL